MEQVFFRVHIRLVSSFCALAGPRVRCYLERTLLMFSFSALVLFALLHHSFTGAYIDHKCFVNSLNGIEGSDPHRMAAADITHIFVTDAISSYDFPQSQHTRMILEEISRQYTAAHRSIPGSIPDPIVTTPSYIFSTQKGFLVLPPSSREKYNITTATFYLPSDSVDKCFYAPHFKDQLKLLIPFKMVKYVFGFDTIVLNLLRKLSYDDGFLFIEHRRKLIDLSYYSRFVFSVTTMNSFGNPLLWDTAEMTGDEDRSVHHVNVSQLIWENHCVGDTGDDGSNDKDKRSRRFFNGCTKEQEQIHILTTWRDRLFLKLCIVITATFLFFAMTSMVSFILKQTQSRMLKFTFLLQYHVRHQLPYWTLVFIHVFESLIFVPIMLGVLFFLFEIFSDKLFSFLLISLVWISEVYSVMSLRTYISIHYFPKILFLYFILLHMYFFSCPYGFTYTAFFTLVMFELHLFLYFLNYFEIPAYASGNISVLRPRYFYSTNTIAPTSSGAVAPTPVTGSGLSTVASATVGAYVGPVSGGGSLPSRGVGGSGPSVLRRNVSGSGGGVSPCQSLESTRIKHTPPLLVEERIGNRSRTNRSSLVPAPAPATPTPRDGVMGGGGGMQREMSFSTPLEEIIAYELAMQRQQVHLQTQEDSTEFVYSSTAQVSSSDHIHSRNTSMSTLNGTIAAAMSSHRLSFHSDSDVFGDVGDIGLALCGSDSGEMSDGGIMETMSEVDVEMKNLDLQFQLSKQIQNQQMAAMMAFDLPVAHSHAHHVQGHHHHHQQQPYKHHGSHSDSVEMGGNRRNENDDWATHVNDESTLPTHAPKKSGVFSNMFSHLKWSRSKANDLPAYSSASSALHGNAASGGDSLSDTMNTCNGLTSLSPAVTSPIHTAASGRLQSPPPVGCISLSSPLASSALESLNPLRVTPQSPLRTLHTSSSTNMRPPPPPTHTHPPTPPPPPSPSPSLQQHQHQPRPRATSAGCWEGGEEANHPPRSPPRRRVHSFTGVSSYDLDKVEEKYIEELGEFSIFGAVYDEDSD